MRYLRQLAKIELVALAALAIFALAFACFSAAQASFATNPLFGVFGTGEVVFVYTIVTGSLPVLLLVAPLYFALRHFHKASMDCCRFGRHHPKLIASTARTLSG